jgi:hypothetical protein
MDKRTANRYPVNCPTTSCWTTADAAKKSSQGVTRDISVRGVYVLDPVSPPLGTRVQLSIAVPSLTGPSRGLQVVATGHVVRVEPQDGNTISGFAAAVRFAPFSGQSPVRPIDKTSERPTHQPEKEQRSS